jgi:hypothetical protein
VIHCQSGESLSIRAIMEESDRKVEGGLGFCQSIALDRACYFRLERVLLGIGPSTLSESVSPY